MAQLLQLVAATMYARPLQTAGMPFVAGFAGHIGTTEFRFHTLVSIRDMINAAEIWRELDRTTSAPNCFFQSYDWCKSWLEHHGGDSHRPIIHMVTQGGRAVAILPMMRVKAWGPVHVLRPLGEPHTQYAGVLTPNGSIPTEALQLLRRALLDVSGIDTIVVQYLPRGSPLQLILGPQSEVQTMVNEASQFDLSVFANSSDFAASMPARRRQAKRRAVAAMHDDGELQLKVIWPGEPAFAIAVGQCLHWKKDWIAQTGRMNSGLGLKGHEAFLASIPGSLEQGGAVIFALYAGARPIAYQLGFIYRRQYHLYTASFDWSLRRWSLGTVLIDMTIGWLISHDVSIFDLMGNPAPYKENWSNQHLQLSGHIISLSARGKIYSALWNRTLRPALKTVYFQLPQTFRTQFASFFGKKVQVP